MHPGTAVDKPEQGRGGEKKRQKRVQGEKGGEGTPGLWFPGPACAYNYVESFQGAPGQRPK